VCSLIMLEQERTRAHKRPKCPSHKATGPAGVRCSAGTLTCGRPAMRASQPAGKVFAMGMVGPELSRASTPAWHGACHMEHPGGLLAYAGTLFGPPILASAPRS
jgi:hypothetical protein